MDEVPPINQPQMQSYSNPMQQYGSAIMSLTDPQSHLYNMELHLKGQALDEKGNIVKVGEPLLNQEGINSIIAQVSSIVSQVTIMSNLNDKDIGKIIMSMIDSLCVDMMLNKLRYNIRDSGTRQKIIHIAGTTAYICMKRAFEEGDRRFWKGSQQEYKVTNETVGGKTSSMISSLLGLKR